LATLQLELVQLEKRNENLQSDNRELLARWLERVQGEAVQVNEARLYTLLTSSDESLMLYWPGQRLSRGSRASEGKRPKINIAKARHYAGTFCKALTGMYYHLCLPYAWLHDPEKSPCHRSLANRIQRLRARAEAARSALLAR
jgi:hypothetical protein